MNKSMSQCENQSNVNRVIDCAWYMGNYKAFSSDSSSRLSLPWEIAEGTPEDLGRILTCYIIHHLSAS